MKEKKTKVKEPKAPKAPKQPKVPKAPKQSKAPKIPKVKNSKSADKVSFFGSIRSKLYIGFCIPVIGIVVLGITSYNKASTLVIDNYVTSVEQTVDSIDTYLTIVTDTLQSRYKTYLNTDEIKNYFMGIYDLMSSDPLAAEKIRKAYQTEMFDNVNGDATLKDIMFISDEHKVFGSTQIADNSNPYSAFMSTPQGQMLSENPSLNHWFGNVCEADGVLGTSKDDYALRLVRKMNGVRALMIIDVDMNTVTNSLNALEVGEGGYVAVVAKDGTEIFSTATRTDEVIFADKDFYKAAVESEANEGTVNVELDGKNYRFIYSKIEGKGLVVCSIISEDFIVSQVKDIKTVTFLIVAIVALAAILTGVYLSGGISKVIKNIVKALNKVAKGDFTINVKSKRKDEFGLIIEALNGTVSNVKDLIAGVQEVNTDLVTAAENVYNSSTLFVDTTKNIKCSVGEIKSGTTRLDEDSDNCLAQMDSLSQKIQMVTVNTNEIGRVVDVTNTSIADGISSVANVTESANLTTKITGDVIDAIEDLQDKSRSIVNIINTINEIAEQTNLLSLNASIEAARAGESGRGFAVVASEISKLADQSLRSAGQIGNIIDDILSKTNHVVEIAKEAYEVVKKQNESVAGTTEAFGEMKDNINALLSSLDEIAANVANIEGARDITLESVESISSVSAETSSCSASALEIVESQNEAIEDLNNAAEALTSKSAQLTELLKQFTV